MLETVTKPAAAEGTQNTLQRAEQCTQRKQLPRKRPSALSNRIAFLLSMRWRQSVDAMRIVATRPTQARVDGSGDVIAFGWRHVVFIQGTIEPQSALIWRPKVCARWSMSQRTLWWHWQSDLHVSARTLSLYRSPAVPIRPQSPDRKVRLKTLSRVVGSCAAYPNDCLCRENQMSEFSVKNYLLIILHLHWTTSVASRPPL